MAWTTPGTAVAGEVLTAAFWNEQVRDNTQYLFDNLAIRQIVKSTDTTQRLTTSTSYVDTNMSVTITPRESSSQIIVISSAFVIPSRSSGDNCRGRLRITNSSNTPLSGAEDSEFGTLRFSYGVSANFYTHAIMIGFDSPATTSATTYKLRYETLSGNTFQLANHTTTGYMYALEVVTS